MAKTSPAAWRSQQHKECDFQRFLLASAAILAASWNFVTATTSPGAETTTAGETVGRGASGGGGGGPGFKASYPTVLFEKRAEDDVRQWEENSLKNAYEVR
jgi:hypothetical protein